MDLLKLLLVPLLITVGLSHLLKRPRNPYPDAIWLQPRQLDWSKIRVVGEMPGAKSKRAFSNSQWLAWAPQWVRHIHSLLPQSWQFYLGGIIGLLMCLAYFKLSTTLKKPTSNPTPHAFLVLKRAGKALFYLLWGSILTIALFGWKIGLVAIFLVCWNIDWRAFVARLHQREQ